jgi:hypothetical protein
MPDKAETPNVFLDTEVFDQHEYDLSSPYFKRLIRLVNSGAVKLFLTTVTVGEIQDHIDERAKQGLRLTVSQDYHPP